MTETCWPKRPYAACGAKGGPAAYAAWVCQARGCVGIGERLDDVIVADPEGSARSQHVVLTSALAAC